jgi:hypothetical protein
MIGRGGGRLARRSIDRKVERKSAATGVFVAARYFSTRRSVAEKILSS